MRRRKDLHPVLFRPGLLGTFRWMAYWLRSRSGIQLGRAARRAGAAVATARGRRREAEAHLSARVEQWREERAQRTAYTQAPLARWRDQ